MGEYTLIGRHGEVVLYLEWEVRMYCLYIVWSDG